VADQYDYLSPSPQKTHPNGVQLATEMAASFVPGLNVAQALRDYKRAMEDSDVPGAIMGALGTIPGVGAASKAIMLATALRKGVVKTEDIQRLVKHIDDLPMPNWDVKIAKPTSNDVTGYHIAQDLDPVMRTGALTNSKALDNIQGYLPSHVGGAYFYSDPSLAMAQRDRLLESLGPEAGDLPIFQMRLKKSHRLRPDEDVGLNSSWQDSFQQGSFASSRPVSLMQLEGVYTPQPGATKESLVDMLRNPKSK